MVSGVTSCDRSGATDYILTGTVECDYRAAAPWFAPVRRTRCRVLIDGEDITGLVGRVTIDEQDDAISRIASFSVLDPRATFWHPASLTRGQRTVAIYGMCATDADGQSEELLFTGTTDAAPNEGAYCPLATVRCLSTAGTFLQETNGCVHYPAFSGVTRREILIAYALSCGIVLTLPTGYFETKVQKAVDISGISLEALILRYCEVEGLYCRELVNGDLEFLTWDDVGQLATPYCDITEDLYVGALREDTPNRPVTLLTVGGSQISQTSTGPQDPVETLEEHQTGVDADGHAWSIDLWVTRWFGVEVKTRREDRKFYGRLGTSLETPRLLLVNRQIVTTEYVTAQVRSPLGTLLAWDPDASEWYTYFLAPTARTSKITDVTEGWFSPLEEAGATDYLWTDGTHHAHTQEQFLETARTVTTFTYDGDTCRLTRQLAVTKGWYTPKDGGTFLYDDGSYRVDAAQSYREVKRVEDTYSDNLAAVEAGTTGNRVNLHETVTQGWVTSGWNTVPTPPRPIESYGLAEFKSERLSGMVGADKHSETTISRVTNGAVSVDQKIVSGPVPTPQGASADTPQFIYSPMTFVVSGWTDLFPVLPNQETNEDAENLTELERVGRRHMRKQLAVRETFAGPAIIGLRALHAITLTDPTRLLDAAQGHVEKLTKEFDTLNGWFGQTVTHAISPAEI